MGRVLWACADMHQYELRDTARSQLRESGGRRGTLWVNETGSQSYAMTTVGPNATCPTSVPATLDSCRYDSKDRALAHILTTIRNKFVANNAIARCAATPNENNLRYDAP